MPQVEGICKSCGSDVICESGKSWGDYHYSCTNPECDNSDGVEVYDTDCDDEHVTFVIWRY